ncbi:phospholipid-translocating P-type ATPase [Ceraceosorus guamensis]|uniref:P-type phospholipid transporter n=1 Tax=Ceraceosorus guamensis TaxID=1522189 RepID=A0A316W056_9BASI|nr:phospholipid-translocating P-type ATPase [Ceraceosorus guamensis]PWN43226.1 phospholipid-translocating P-type ATPase [Ceraceosorus guamensis]
MPLFGAQHPAPHLDDHNYDPHSPGPYQHGPSGRDYLSDPTHPDYDPAVDPNLQLRTVRTAAESIAESHRSEARRDARNKARKGSLLGKLGRGRTLLRRGASTKQGGALKGLLENEFGHHGPGGTGATGTGGEGVGVPFDSAQQGQTPDYPTQDAARRAEQEAFQEAQEAHGEATEESSGKLDTGMKKSKSKKPLQRRNVYLNTPLLPQDAAKNGEPKAKYARNKVRTSKYTFVTFLPRFLTEQFRRLANVYFLLLVVIQIFPQFGATIPQIAMLPLVAILTITAIKDSIEDYRRHVLDNTVNNSAVTRLGGWHNVNLPKDGRSFFGKLFGMGGRDKVSKGVRKLREKEDAIGMRIVKGESSGAQSMTRDQTQRTFRSDSLNSGQGFNNQLETIASESEWGHKSAKGPAAGNLPQAGGSAMSFGTSTGGAAAQYGAGPNGVVDYRRSTSGSARWERTLWKKLEVGDIVLLRENDQVPADLVLLNSSDPDGNAFIETKNLDGETNLKARKCLKATMGIQTEEDIEHARFIIDSEPPHANLYSYNALLKYLAPAGPGDEYTDAAAGPGGRGAPGQERMVSKVEPVTANELLLRGCALRNTEWVIGIVVFTGADTKIMLNGGETPSKRSKIEKETNVNVAVNFVLLLLMCSACATVGGIILNQTNTSRRFYEPGALDSSSNIINALFVFGTCLVLFQNIVPISLYISIELTKTISAFFIYQDVDMYYEPLDHPCVPKTWGIVDDLGQIEYIFSDKTGTLTQNVMEFKKCSINGSAYGEGITEAMIGAMKRDGKDTSGLSADEQEAKLEGLKTDMIDKLNRTFKNRYLRPDQTTLISPQLADELGPSSPAGPEQRRNIIAFFRALALCHTALADRPEAANPFVLEYKAQSPDEAALVSAARDVGAVFINKNNTSVDIEVAGQPERYTPLKVLEFNSTRKRMSVIVREPDGRILMITKGADSVIYQRLRGDHDAQLKAQTQAHLEEFANAGLRTLCIAYRYLEEREYAEWARIHDEAAASLTDRDDKIDEACEKIEYGLTLLGATALEDKLQVGVPETIEKLHQAGIKLWILTGDKLQTAIEIGFSCNLLSTDMEIMIISADHEAGTRTMLEAACNKIAAAGRPVVIEKTERRGGILKKSKHRLDIARTGNAPSGGFAVVIDGETLRYALDPALKPMFLALTTLCETVVCCRVSPAQKALTVKLVKDGKKAMTLSIGDGANDVSMIQEAHIGVGIAGLEGAQASMSADYAIGQFRYLAKLLLVHGHWNTYRIGVLHQVFFYKNLIWTGALLLFQIFCQADATYLFDYGLILLYNLVFTSLPVIMLGALDQDVRAPALMAFPQTYRPGREGKLYTRTQFWTACIDGMYQAAACFFVAWAAWFYFPAVMADGKSLDALTAMGTTVGTSCVIAANLYCGLALKNWSIIIWVVIALSNLAFFIWIAIYSAPAWGNTFSPTAFILFQTIQFWAIVLLSVLVCLLPRYTWNAWQSSFHPTEIDIVRQGWIAGNMKQRLGIKSHKARKGNGRHGEKASYTDSPDVNLGAAELGKSDYSTHHSTSPQGRSREFSGGTASDSSLSPLPTNYEQRYGDRAGNEARQPDPKARTSRTRDSLMPWGGRSGTAMSFYDPDQLPSTSHTPEPNSPTGRRADYANRDDGTHSPYVDDDEAHEGDDMPQIRVQRATVDRPFAYAQPNSQANSRTALAAQSTDSFEQHFETAFGDNQRSQQQQQQHHAPSPLRQPLTIPTVNVTSPQSASPADRYHNRFNTTSPPAQAAPHDGTPRQSDFPLPGTHPRDDSAMTQGSWHSAHSQERYGDDRDAQWR